MLNCEQCALWEFTQRTASAGSSSAHVQQHTAPTSTRRTENEKNRRRDLVTVLRTRREQMLTSLKREQPHVAREALLGGAGLGSSSNGTMATGARETDVTAELSSQGLLQLQHQVMQQQDRDLESLERTVVGTKHIALQVRRHYHGVLACQIKCGY